LVNVEHNRDNIIMDRGAVLVEVGICIENN
ncbi:unnamed protein product, partial [marine sediment metagenome]